MKKIFICVLILLATRSSEAFFPIPRYNTITPINLTIGTFEIMDDNSRTRFTEAIRHFAVAVHEMTHGVHQILSSMTREAATC